MESLKDIEDRVFGGTGSLADEAVSDRVGYKGCGKAWAAVHEGEVVALLYMDGEHCSKVGFDWDGPERKIYWAYWQVLSPCTATQKLHALRNEAVAAGLVKDNGAALNNLRKVIQIESSETDERNAEIFGKWRLFARALLEGLGKVVSGQCSCHEFLPKRGGKILSV